MKVHPGEAVTPTLVIRNGGTYDETGIPVRFRVDSCGIPVYNQLVTIPSLDSAASDTITFPNWNAGSRGGLVYEVTAWHSFTPDTSIRNDTLHRSVMVRRHEISAVAMNIGGRVRAGHPYAPVLTVRAADYTEHNVTCFCWIDSSGARIYNQNVMLDSVPVGGTAAATFPVWLVGPAGAQYEITMFHTFSDPNRGDDTLYRSSEATDQMRILIAYADLGGTPDSLIAGMVALGDSIELYDAASNTPTLGELTPYDGVVIFSDNTFLNAAGFGDVLADYVDLGHPLVIGTFALTTGWNIAGRILTGEYLAMNPGSNASTSGALGWFNGAHGIMDGVDTVTDMYRSMTTWGPAADSVAKWDDGKPYVATSPNMRVIAVNNYPGYVAPERFTGRDWTAVYHNALLWGSGGTSGLEQKPPFSISPDFTLCQSKPNPFRDRTVISYSVPRALDVNIAVYDLSGRSVATLVNGRQPAGRHNATWNRTDGAGNRVAAGVYFYKLTSGSYRTTRKLVVE